MFGTCKAVGDVSEEREAAETTGSSSSAQLRPSAGRFYVVACQEYLSLPPLLVRLISGRMKRLMMSAGNDQCANSETNKEGGRPTEEKTHTAVVFGKNIVSVLRMSIETVASNFPPTNIAVCFSLFLASL